MPRCWAWNRRTHASRVTRDGGPGVTGGERLPASLSGLLSPWGSEVRTGGPQGTPGDLPPAVPPRCAGPGDSPGKRENYKIVAAESTPLKSAISHARGVGNRPRPTNEKNTPEPVPSSPSPGPSRGPRGSPGTRRREAHAAHQHLVTDGLQQVPGPLRGGPRCSRVIGQALGPRSPQGCPIPGRLRDRGSLFSPVKWQKES